MIRAYVGKPGDTVVDDHTDNELVSIVRRDLSQVMTFKLIPIYNCQSFAEKMPQYHVGHIQQIRQIQAHIKQTYPRLRVTGASFVVVGLPDCITQGKVAAEEVIAEL
ncbi:hypothetical protein ACVXZZ_00975 [Staphylococcus aureus]